MSADADAATVKAVAEATTTKADVADTITKEAAKATVRVSISTADAADIIIKPRQGLDKNITTWAIHSETSSL